MSKLKPWLGENSGAIVSALAMVAGLAAGFLLQNEFASIVGSVEHGAWLIKVMVIPAIVVFAVVANIEVVTTSELPARFFIALIGGYEVGVLILAWRILMYWYRHPENSHMEPLFVSAGVALAVLEWCRSNLKNLS